MMIKRGDNTYQNDEDDHFQLYHLIDGEYVPFDLIEEAYKSAIAFYKVMSRVGVNITPEQEAQIREYSAKQETAKAQRLILDLLNNEFKDG